MSIPAGVNWSLLSDIGNNLGSALRNRRISQALSSLPPNASLGDRARALLEADPRLGMDALMKVEALGIDREKNAIAAKKLAQPKPMPAAAMRQYNEAITNTANLGNTIKFLEEAQGLIGEDGKGIFDTAAAPYQTLLGTQLNVGGGLDRAEDWINKTFGTNSNVVDPDKAIKTSRFQQIMEAESLKTLSRELKGPTAVQEVMTYKQILANPNKTNAEKAIALKGMIAAIKNDLAAQGKSIENIEKVYGSVNGTDSAPDQDDPGSASPEQLRVWAQEAIDQGADPEQVRQMLEEYGVE